MPVLKNMWAPLTNRSSNAPMCSAVNPPKAGPSTQQNFVRMALPKSEI